MFHELYDIFSSLDEWMWSTVAIPIVVFIGTLLTVRFRFYQIVSFKDALRSFFQLTKTKVEVSSGEVHPLQAFFASIGGCIGIGNIVAVCTAIQIGGPGAIFWMWVAAFLGMIVKYAEVYLGVKYRVTNPLGGYLGGPMYYLQKVVRSSWLPLLFAFLLAIYGTEIYMFSVVTHSISENWNIPSYLVISLLLVLILYASSGGISRVGKISSILIPGFVLIFGGMCLWILALNAFQIPYAFQTIFQSAFTGHAPLGAFAGSGMILAMSQGVARGCYTGDIGIGYAGIVNAETSQKKPEKQAQLTLLGVFIDTFVICTFTTLLIVVTGVWKEDIPASLLVQRALEGYFPYMTFFMPIFIFLLGYSSLIAFFVVGLKCARFIHPRYGETLYYFYATLAFVLFSFVSQSAALLVMSLAGVLLLMINLFGIYRLRKEVKI